jgi:hypothetical protein
MPEQIMQQLIYCDLNAFRHFAGAYQKWMLPPDLRHNIVLSPITMLEVFTHLAERCGESICKQIQGLPNWLNQKDVHLLPWPDEYIALRLFDKLPEDDLFTCAVQEIVQTCLNGSLPDVLEDVGELRECTVCIKRKYATAFQALVEIHRNEQHDMGELSEGWLKYRVKQYTDGDRARILEALSAFHEFDLEEVRLAVSSKNFDYDSQKHQNYALAS